MKNKLVLAAMFVVMVVLATSCATTRKYGCPSVSQSKPKPAVSVHA